MKLIPEWKKAARMISMQCMAAAGAIQAAWVALPPSMLNSVDPDTVRLTTLVLLVLGMLGRVLKQESVSGDEA